MKRKILISTLCAAVIITGVIAGTLAVSAAETKTITENMESIQELLLDEEISLSEYTQSIHTLNRVLESKKLQSVKATITFEASVSVEEAYRMTQPNSMLLERLEMRFYRGAEPFTAFILNLGEEAVKEQIQRIESENDIVFDGVISANGCLPSEGLSVLEKLPNVYCVDASADDYLEEKSGIQSEQKAVYRKSLAWELGN